MEPVLTQNRVLTVPNMLSVIRLALIPAFVYVVLSAHANGWG
ncbi:CDP-diacylglycerol--glycerol-3-phosphate 3-phosphatidyltransferase [Mycobacterium tuberculosis variant bovis BCG]|nr:CDP-diacylglycerol--glycerol-3-phosphate 3-phosphatidyltransferase [Mycobacterium tuberculosis variant bovis BCG]